MKTSIFIGALAAAMPFKDSADCSNRNAIVYRGASVCDGCPESVGALLQSSPYNFTVQYAGPDEDIDVSDETLKGVTIFAFPGGPDQEGAYNETRYFKPALQRFVAAGGHYLGFCLGAYMADHDQGYGLMPQGTTVGSEIEQPHAEVTTDVDTTITVDWTLSSGKKIHRKVYFQEGAYVSGFKSDKKGKVLARYSANGNIAASVSPYGKGWVGLTGPHPEADESWYKDANVKESDGLSFDLGYDLIHQTLNGGK